MTIAATASHTLSPADRMRRIPPYFYHQLQQRLSEIRARGVDVIRVDAGSPDLPPAPHIVAALSRSAETPSNHGYMPYPGTPEYRAAWAEFYRRRFQVELDPAHEVLGLIGSKEGVFHLHLALVNPGDVVLVPDPGYAAYTNGALFAEAEVVHMPLLARNRYLPDFSAIPDSALRQARIMWLNYPNNPTGAVAPLDLFADAVALARQYGFVVAHDAPYTEITYDGYRAPSLLQVPGAREVGVEFHSLSKTYNMGGWRAGVAAGNAEALGLLGTLKSNIDSGLFKGILDAGIAALTGDQGWIEARNAHYRRRRDLALEAVRWAGLEAEAPAGAIYIWARLPDRAPYHDDDLAYAGALLDATGVSLTPGSVFGPSGRGYIRISLCLDDARLAEALARLRRFGVG
jgi:LL-diaminopimelate aminotransferase